MNRLSDIMYRLHLRFSGGRLSWHNRFYRPSVYVVHSGSEIWFEEGENCLKALPASVLGGRFEGRSNLLLSGPSVKGLKEPELLTNHNWIGVNGSPALMNNVGQKMSIYHVNDASFIRSDISRFLQFAALAEYTVIDYRGVYELLRLAPGCKLETKLVIFDGWAWPFRLPKGKIESLVLPPEKRGVYLSPDLSLGLAQGGTVAYTAAQLAWLSGFSTLYIYGLDLNNSGRSYVEANPQPQMLDKAFEDTILPAFELFAQETSKTGFKTFNCNPKSRLPNSIIPHIDPEATLGR